MQKPKKARLIDVADIERCRSGVVYPAGTCYIQVSACAKNSAAKWHITEQDTELPGKYAAVLPKIPIVPLYLLETLEYSADEFFCRYVGSNINIQLDIFKYYTISLHERLEDQQEVVNVLTPIKQDIEITQREISRWHDLKTFSLENMFPLLKEYRSPPDLSEDHGKKIPVEEKANGEIFEHFLKKVDLSDLIV